MTTSATEKPDKYNVVRRHCHGREREQIVAARDIERGEVIMVDKAALTWLADPMKEGRRYLPLFEAFDGADQHVRDMVLQALSIELEHMTPYLRQGVENIRSAVTMLPTAIKKGRSMMDLQNIVLRAHIYGVAEHFREDHQSFYLRNVLLQHDCDPNTFARSPEDGWMQTVALKNIAKGDPLTRFSLHQKYLLDSKENRRGAMLRLAARVCMCARCTASTDDMLIWTCPLCSQAGLRLYHAQNGERSLRCDKCSGSVPYGLHRAKIERFEGTRTVPSSAKAALNSLRYNTQQLGTEHCATQLLRMEVLMAMQYGKLDTHVLAYEAFESCVWLHSLRETHPLSCMTIVLSFTAVIDQGAARVRHGLDAAKVALMIRDILPVAALQVDFKNWMHTLAVIMQYYLRDCLSLACQTPSTGGKRLHCGACQRTWYCSAACQQEDWKSGHKAACKLHKVAKQAMDAHRETYSVPAKRPQERAESPTARQFRKEYTELFDGYQRRLDLSRRVKTTK